jgi:hypothetical protein
VIVLSDSSFTLRFFFLWSAVVARGEEEVEVHRLLVFGGNESDEAVHAEASK